MANGDVRKVVIAGGGTAGWMAAAALSRAYRDRLSIRLIESDEIGIVGVGEATIPTLLAMHQFLGIDEAEMMKATSGTFKLGIEFADWSRKGQVYSHQFGPFGKTFGLVPLHQYWLARHLDGGEAARQAGSLWDYSFNDRATRADRFGREDRIADSPLEGLVWAWHFDAARYAGYLRGLAEKWGVRRSEGRITGVEVDGRTGFIRSLTLASGETVGGDLFIDCTGFRALLIGDALKTGFDDWSRWLPVDRAWAVPSAPLSSVPPYTRATARDSGWQWRIPLQHRVGNGHVFCSAFMDEDAARQVLLDNLESEPLADPRLVRFTTGRRISAWVGNCVALGLASGFLEPLESTSIHITQAAITRLITMFPDLGFNPVEIAEYNRLSARDYEVVRDFILLHYIAGERSDSAFWRHMHGLDVPGSLARKIAFFHQHGRVLQEPDDLFKEMSWVQVFLGQGIMPDAAPPLARVLPAQQVDELLANIRAIYDHAAARLPDHGAFIERYCRAMP